MKCVKIEKSDPGVTYDLTVHGISSFQASNGVILHNCLDAINTYRLYFDCLKKHPDLRNVFLVDNLAAEAIRRMENFPVILDLEALRKEAAKSTNNILDYKKRVFQLLGYEINLNSNVQKANALLAYGESLTKKTPGGSYKVDIQTLSELDSELGKILVDYAKEEKYNNSYVKTLLDVAEQKKVVHYNFLTTKVPTGRLACGGDSKNDYVLPLNVQCLDPETKVLTQKGIKTMRELEKKYKIWDGESYTEFQGPVFKTKDIYEIRTNLKPVLRASLDHDILTDGGWVKVKELKPGDRIITDSILLSYLGEDHSKAYVKEIVLYKENAEVCDISVPSRRLFSANGYIVHNSIPKAHQIERKLVEDKTHPLGWSFNDDATENYYLCETGGDHHAIRRAFIPQEDSYWVSIDYSGEELRIAANLSGEKVWIDSFLSGKDLHMATAQSVFGPNADKNDRKIAKTVNFLCLYGGSSHTLAPRIGTSVEKAQEIIDLYKKGLPTLKRWQEYLIKFSKKNDMSTFLGRKRRMAKYYSTNDKKIRSFGHRTALNSPVQGTGADILKLAFCRIYEAILKNSIDCEKVKLLHTVHDEINFSVSKDYLKEFASKIIGIMTLRFPNWPVPFEVDFSVGLNWGDVVSFKITPEGFLPKGKYVEREEKPEIVEVMEEVAVIDNDTVNEEKEPEFFGSIASSDDLFSF